MQLFCKNFNFSALPMKPSSANSSATDIAMLLKQQQEQQQSPQQPNLGKYIFFSLFEHNIPVELPRLRLDCFGCCVQFEFFKIV